MDKLASLRSTLNSLAKKKGTLYTQIDLGDKVYEQSNQVKPDVFVNSHYGGEFVGASLMTSVLVAVPGKRSQEFEQSYWKLLIDFNEAGVEGWSRRTEKELIADWREEQEAARRQEQAAADKAAAEAAKKKKDAGVDDVEEEKKEADAPEPEKEARVHDDEIKKMPKISQALAQKVKEHEGQIERRPGAVPGSC